MNRIKIGVHLGSMGLPLRRGLEEASRLGVAGVKADAAGDLLPEKLSQTGRREFRNVLRAKNLELASLRCLLRRGLDTAEGLEPRIDHVRQVMSLAYDLGPRLVTVQAGMVPGDETDPARGLLKEALAALGAHGDRVGCTLALETGLESGETLGGFLRAIDTGSLAVNFDPANLLVNKFPPLDALRHLAGLVAQVQAKDARKSGPNRSAGEVPLGHGDIDWMYLFGSLEEAGYTGWAVVQRDVGDRKLADVQEGVAFLRRILG